MDENTRLKLVKEKRHDFEEKKYNLKKFADSQRRIINIDLVPTDAGLFGMADHKVTGKELNERTKSIQSYLTCFNNEISRIFDFFTEVYNVIQILDHDFVEDIVKNIDAIWKTSDDVKKHQDKLLEQQRKLKSESTEIKKLTSSNKFVMQSLVKFQKKLEKLDHLTDVDSIWNNCVLLRDDIIKNAQQIEEWKEYYKKISSDMITSEEVYEHIEKINSEISQVDSKLLESAIGLSEKLEQRAAKLQERIDDTRKIFMQNLENHIEKLNEEISHKDMKFTEKTEEILKQIEERVIGFQRSISETRSTFVAELQNSVEQIDIKVAQVNQQIVEKTRELKNQIDQQDTELQNKIEDTKQQLLSDMNQTKDSIEQEMQIHVGKADKLEHKVDDEITELKGKIKILYYALGGTAGLFVMETILNVMGVI